MNFFTRHALTKKYATKKIPEIKNQQELEEVFFDSNAIKKEIFDDFQATLNKSLSPCLFELKNLERSIEQFPNEKKILFFKTELNRIVFLIEGLKQNKMFNNIYSIKFDFELKQNLFEVQLELDLKTKGLHWAILFSKYIQNNFIQKYSKEVTLRYELDAKNIPRERYLVTWERIILNEINNKESHINLLEIA